MISLILIYSLGKFPHVCCYFCQTASDPCLPPPPQLRVCHIVFWLQCHTPRLLAPDGICVPYTPLLVTVQLWVRGNGGTDILSDQRADSARPAEDVGKGRVYEIVPMPALSCALSSEAHGGNTGEVVASSSVKTVRPWMLAFPLCASDNKADQSPAVSKL